MYLPSDTIVVEDWVMPQDSSHQYMYHRHHHENNPDWTDLYIVRDGKCRICGEEVPAGVKFLYKMRKVSENR